MMRPHLPERVLLYKPEEVPWVIGVTVLTNLSILLPANIALRRGEVWVCVMMFSLLITSICYHIADAYENSMHHRYIDAFGMSAGNWHRLDNIYAILSMVFSFWLHLRFPSEKIEKAVITASVAITLFCQERGPWRLEMTIAPILVTWILSYVSVWYSRQHGKSIFVVNFFSVWYIMYLAFMSIALFFFVLGLNENHDYLRLFHGLWHFFAGIAAYFLMQANADGIDRERKEGNPNGAVNSGTSSYSIELRSKRKEKNI